HDLPASKIAELSDVSRPTINQLLMKLRLRIAQVCDASSPLSGEVEVDESYFGARRVRGKKGRGAGGKTIVFGILERQGKVYTEIVPDASKKQLQAAIRGKVTLGSIIHSDGWRGYNGLVDMGYKKHFRVHHGEHEFARGNCHINGIESFWSSAKRRLAKFNGVPRHTFHLHLKECEFRFNYREENLYDRIL
ncbi:IS1595 family transposase, partial [Candidatus Thiosymbion oneisti]|uniref:IS1595 family transposase n=1 Tax=Candidatus Thiosymbion oneisti TaxID=589554 RepID=UPI00114CD1F5